MGMKTNDNTETARIAKPEEHNFLRLWGGLVQRTFPFMEEEVGELGPKARLFVTICEAVVKPEAFEYAKWKGVGRPPARRMPVFKAFLFKAVHDIPTTKELVERILLEPQTRRLCGWADPGDVPCESKFSEINTEFAEMGFTEDWFDEFVRAYAVDEPGGTSSQDSAPIPVRAKASNAKRTGEELDPDQPERPSRLEWQAGRSADEGLAELPQVCDWGTKRDAHGKKKHWKGIKLHAEVTRDGIPVAVACTSASVHDSQAFIPLMKKATERIGTHVALADAAYDAEAIRETSMEEGNVPLIDANKRSGGEARRMTAAEREIYKDRGVDERFFAHLIDAHGGRHVRVREPKKVWQHLMYGVLVIAVEQTMRSMMLC